MTAEIVNLNKVRKARARASKAAAAVVNRARSGRTSAERAMESSEALRREARLDDAKLEE